jgi:hypothetical protein
MKRFGSAAALLGAVSLMGALLVGQREYQKSWQPSGSAQTVSVGPSTVRCPTQLAAKCRPAAADSLG